MSPPYLIGGVFNENGRLSAPLFREALKQRLHYNTTSAADFSPTTVSQPEETIGEPGADPSPGPADSAGPSTA